jgi:hypothetical protein
MKFDKPYLVNLNWLMDFAKPLDSIFGDIEVSTVNEICKRCFKKNNYIAPKSDGLTIFRFDIVQDVIPVLKQMANEGAISNAECGNLIAKILRYQGYVLLQPA